MDFMSQKYNSRLAYDPSYPDIDHSVFKKCDWKEFYQNVKEEIPVNAQETREKEVDILSIV